jgi:hypothetical protein
MEFYNRYQQFLIDGKQTMVPFVKLPSRSSDQRYIYKKNRSRLDKISLEKYGSPTFGWLIMLANPQYEGLETNITEDTILIIPYPLVAAIQDYKSALETHFFYYGR